MICTQISVKKFFSIFENFSTYTNKIEKRNSPYELRRSGMFVEKELPTPCPWLSSGGAIGAVSLNSVTPLKYIGHLSLTRMPRPLSSQERGLGVRFWKMLGTESAFYKYLSTADSFRELPENHALSGKMKRKQGLDMGLRLHADSASMQPHNLSG